MNIRNVMKNDLDAVFAIEQACFPAVEAASREALLQRICTYPESFFVAVLDGRIVGFINGAVVQERTICDDMFTDISFHDQNGAYQAVFGLDVLPSYRHSGIAAQLMRALIASAQQKNRQGVILTCKEALLHYYTRFGFVNLGISQSVHGGAVWYDLLLEFS